MSSWQPFSTAPKDGSTILVYGRHAFPIRAARWDSSTSQKWVFIDKETQKLVGSGAPKGWYFLHLGWDAQLEWADRDEGGPDYPFEPTHWLAILPPPPGAA